MSVAVARHRASSSSRPQDSYRCSSASAAARLYVIEFTATNALGESCSGAVEVIVPLSKRSGAVDSGPTFVS